MSRFSLLFTSLAARLSSRSPATPALVNTASVTPNARKAASPVRSAGGRNVIMVFPMMRSRRSAMIVAPARMDRNQSPSNLM